MWSLSVITRTALDGLRRRELELTEEHAVRGLDSFREIDLHPLLSQTFTESSHEAIREACFPSPPEGLPGRNARDRVDLVLLPEGKKALYDPVDAHKELHKADGTLFETVAELRGLNTRECDPSEAFWIEIKAIPQFRYVDGVPQPNTRYAHELINGPAEDVVKLAADPMIRHGGVLVLLFTELEEAGEHDLAIAVRTMIDRDLPVGMPDFEKMPIQDRGGNAWCTLGLIPVRF